MLCPAGGESDHWRERSHQLGAFCTALLSRLIAAQHRGSPLAAAARAGSREQLAGRFAAQIDGGMAGGGCVTPYELAVLVHAWLHSQGFSKTAASFKRCALRCVIVACSICRARRPPSCP